MGESALAKFRAEGGTFADLTEQEQLFLTELIAHETEVLFGSERMLRRLAKEKRSLAKRLLERIEDFFRILKMSKEERKAFVKLEQARACLEKALLAAGGSSEKSGHKTGILFSKDIESYPYDMQTVIKEYLTSVDEKLLQNAIDHRNKKQSKFERTRICEVDENFAEEVKALFSIDTTGFTVNINSNGYNHIEKRHGKNGEADQSMSQLEDLARISYVIQNRDSIEPLKDEKGQVYSSEFNTKENTPAPLVLLKKKINGTYYCVIAETDAKYKKVWVQSAFINKKDRLTQVLNDEISSLRSTSETPLASHLSGSSIHQNGDSVKPDAKKSKADADFESFSAEDFFHEAAARSVSEVVGESEKSTKSPEAPRAAKKRGLSEGQAKKLEANYVNHKTFSRKEVAEVVDSITRKHLDFGEDYGVLIGKGRQEAI
ncbi:MAG: hypothetical protein IJ344_01050, partial [Clostridia bacterium]|nr:hypothetical protein [Clostridia bacterium]